MKEYSSDCDLKQHHAKIVNCIRCLSLAKPIGDKNSNAELIFAAKRSQSEQKNMVKVNHIREIYPIEK